MPGETGEPRLTTMGLVVEVRWRSLEHYVILTPLSVTSCVSPMSTPLSVSLSTSSNGPASPYSAHTPRTYVSGDKASWSAPNVVPGRLGLWNWRQRTPARSFKNWAEMFNSSQFSAMCSSASCLKEGAGYRMTRLFTVCHIIRAGHDAIVQVSYREHLCFWEEHTHTHPHIHSHFKYSVSCQ